MANGSRNLTAEVDSGRSVTASRFAYCQQQRRRPSNLAPKRCILNFLAYLSIFFFKILQFSAEAVITWSFSVSATWINMRRDESLPVLMQKREVGGKG